MDALEKVFVKHLVRMKQLEEMNAMDPNTKQKIEAMAPFELSDKAEKLREGTRVQVRFRKAIDPELKARLEEHKRHGYLGRYRRERRRQRWALMLVSACFVIGFITVASWLVSGLRWLWQAWQPLGIFLGI